jgi:hypothetical protein
VSDIADPVEYLEQLMFGPDPVVVQWGATLVGPKKRGPQEWLIVGRLVISSPALVFVNRTLEPLRSISVKAEWPYRRLDRTRSVRVDLTSDGAPWPTTYGSAMGARLAYLAVEAT